MSQSPVIGIDLGTINSCVAAWLPQRGTIEIIPNEQDQRTTPSCVSFTDTERLIGEAAKNQVATNPRNTIYDVKRFIGRRFRDESVQNDMKMYPFEISARKNQDKPMFEVNYKGRDKKYTAEEISSMVLSKMKQNAETYLRQPVKYAVITVPANFNYLQRQATKDAGIIAGFERVQLLLEPVAAAIAYTRRDNTRHKINILVFDLGGGTCDVSIVTFSAGDEFEVKATAGDSCLGGKDFDSRMVDHFVEEFKTKYNKDVKGNPIALAKLRAACEKAKTVLSVNKKTRIEVPGLFEDDNISMEITHGKFEELIQVLLDKCMEMVKKCLRDANMGSKNVDKVVLVGGSTRIPKLQEMLQELFVGKELCKSISADEAVATGAAMVNADSRMNQVCDVTGSQFLVWAGNKWLENITDKMKKNRKNRQYFMMPYDHCNQSSTMSIQVYHGDRLSRTNDNLTLVCEIELYDIPKLPKGLNHKIKIYIHVDTDDLTINANIFADVRRSINTRVTNDCGKLSKEEIKKMAEVAKKLKNLDEVHRENVKAYNALEGHAYDLRNEVKEAETRGLFIPDEVKWRIKEAIKEAILCLDQIQSAEALHEGGGDDYEDANIMQQDDDINPTTEWGNQDVDMSRNQLDRRVQSRCYHHSHAHSGMLMGTSTTTGIPGCDNYQNDDQAMVSHGNYQMNYPRTAGDHGAFHNLKIQEACEAERDYPPRNYCNLN